MGRENTRRERAAMGGPAWYEDVSEIARLFRWLQEQPELALPLDEVAYFLSKPWKWESERAQMLAAEQTQ